MARPWHACPPGTAPAQPRATGAPCPSPWRGVTVLALIVASVTSAMASGFRQPVPREARPLRIPRPSLPVQEPLPVLPAPWEVLVEASGPAPTPEPATKPLARSAPPQGLREQLRHKVLAKRGAGRYAIHPFFHNLPSDKVGDIRTLCWPKRASGRPNQAVIAPKDGSLVWTSGLDDKIQYLTSGQPVSCIATVANTRIRHLLQNGPESFCFFGDKSFGTVILPEQSGSGQGKITLSDNAASLETAQGPESVVATPDGDVIGFTQKYFFRMPKDLLSVRAWPRDPTVPVPTTLLWEPSLKQVYGLSPGFDEVMVFNAETGLCQASFNLGKGASPSALALAPDGQVWVAYGGCAMVEVINPAREGESKSYPPERPELPTQGFTSIAPGPDGAMWLTSDQSSWFTRVTLDGVFSRSAPDAPIIPCALAPGHEGRLLFSTQGMDTLAQVIIVPRCRPLKDSQRSAPDPAEAGQGPSATPRKPAPGLSREERHKRHDTFLAKVQARFAESLVAGDATDAFAHDLLGLAEPLPSGTEEDKQGSPVPPEPERKAKAPVPPSVPSAQSLEQRRVFLSPKGLKHIWDHHGYDHMGDKSQFHASLGTPEQLEAFLAKGVAEAMEVGRVTDCWGRCYTLCRHPDTGYYNSWGRFRETDRFAVVTIPYLNEEDGECDHIVVTAYPISKYF